MTFGSFINHVLIPDLSKVMSGRIITYCPICKKLSYLEIDFIDIDNDIVIDRKIKLAIFLCFSCFDDDDNEYYLSNVDEEGNCPFDILCYDQHLNLVHTEHCSY